MTFRQRSARPRLPLDFPNDRAFGGVLYEMLSGRPAFYGETITDVLMAVVTREPDWSAVPASTPPRIRRLVARATPS